MSPLIPKLFTIPKHQRLYEIECTEIHSLHNIKFTYQKIADQLKVSIWLVQYSLIKKNSTLENWKGRKPYLSDQQVDEIETFYCSSCQTRRMSYLELANTRFAEWGPTEN